MTYKTILVHIDTEAEAGTLTAAAILLAKKFSSTLIGLHVQPVIHVPSLIPNELLTGMLAQHRQTALAAAKRMGAHFQQTTSRAGVAGEWHTVAAEAEPAARVALRWSHAADLVVLGQPDPEVTVFQGHAMTEDILLGAGRPVLMVPRNAKPVSIGERVLVAWNDSRESARATFDAMPFLTAAEGVHMLTDAVSLADREDRKEQAVPGAEIGSTLDRHNVTVTVSSVGRVPGDITDALLAAALTHGSDLIVMGGYGRVRLAEVLFGGATLGMLQRMTVPVLMSH